ncbi:hypothetical protein HDU96_010312 [Phlyctochytrium bullatum]|nr:hypothetical protein HDU96_010312 [Phlyctochytrium bullatum]
MTLAINFGCFESVKFLYELGGPGNDEELQSPLHLAIGDYDVSVDILKFLLEHGADTEARHDGCTALLAEAKKRIDNRFLEVRHMTALALLIASGADIEACDKAGRTALYHLAMNGRSKSVQLLIDAGADVNATDWDGYTPLNPRPEFDTTCTRETEGADYAGTSRVLKANGAVKRATNRLTRPPLYDALESNDCGLVRSLLEAGASLHASNYMSSPPLHFALEKGRAQAAAILLAAGADPNARSWDKKTALHWLAHGRVNAIEAEDLLARMLERTALYHAARNGRSKSVQLLIDAGADVNATDWYGHTPLNPRWEPEVADPVSRILKANGAIKRATPSHRLTRLRLYDAVEGNNCELIRSLLEAGASLHASNYMSSPPLHFALEKGMAEAASILLAAGADPNARCWDKKTALHYLAHGHVKATDAENLLAQMMERGVDMNARETNGYTALHYAVRHSKERLLLLLRTKGIDLYVPNNQGMTWFEVAENFDEDGHGEISIRWLKENVPDVCNG